MSRPLETNNEKIWTVLCHLTGFLIYLVPFFGNLIVLLLIWSIKGEDPIVKVHAKAAINYQIGMMVYSFLAAIVFLVILAIEFAVTSDNNAALIMITIILGIVAASVWNLLYCIWIIMAAIKANNNELFEYPIKLNLVK